MSKVIHTKTRKLNLILALSTIIMLATIYSICSIPISANAEEPVLADNTSSVFSLSSDRSLTVSVSSANIDLALTPSAEGIFKSTSDTPLTVTVSTNNATGYNLNMTTTTTDLTRMTSLSGQTPVIHTLSGSGSFTADTFETNAWGFSLDGATYQPVTLSRQITQTTKESNSSTTNITFAAKLNNEIPHGEYRSTITFIATTNPLEATFDTAFDAAGKTQVSYNGQNYYKMQDMSGFICSMVATPTDKTSAESTQLIDTRDNSVYWVSKLLDGNCWMTQNLDLDLNSTVALTSDTTDLHSVTSWTPTRSTINASGNTMNTYPTNTDSWATDGTNSWSNDNYTPYSVDAGYKYILPIEKTTAGAGTSNDQPYDTVYNSLAECQAAASDPSKNSFGLACDGHTSVGNYYNFAAASATNDVETTLGGSANVVQNKVMPDSICPKGWRLPIEQTTNNEFSTLLGPSNYNIYNGSNSELSFENLNSIRTAPLYFVRSGNVNGGTLNYAGRYSNAWSSTIGSSINGYYLYLLSTNIYPARNSYRFHGFAVRCLARTDLTIEEATYLQDVTPEMRQNTRVGTTTTVLDKRDNNEYTIGKLEDGNVWLLDNLRLGGDTEITLTPSDTNIATNFTLPASSTDKFNDDTAGWTTPGINTSKSGTMSTNGVYQGGIGVFYNYCAASAGTICAAKGENASNASYDICPASWRMPTGGTDGEYQVLYTAYNSDYANLQTALRTPLSGYFLSGSAKNQGRYGYFWSSTRNDGNSMYFLRVNASSVEPQDNYDRRSGNSVRCVLK